MQQATFVKNTLMVLSSIGQLSPTPVQVGEFCRDLPLPIEYIGKPYAHCYEVGKQVFEQKYRTRH